MEAAKVLLSPNIRSFGKLLGKGSNMDGACQSSNGMIGAGNKSRWSGDGLILVDSAGNRDGGLTKVID
ncbi:hypothetical protein ACH5RR_039366 [Cinchona calisaya]|uniref:Uncharacterized protein n=1 Tax=Cinchona calisaya TaxID=153742 RepID=A0ABD2XZF2_9GENT